METNFGPLAPKAAPLLIELFFYILFSDSFSVYSASYIVSLRSTITYIQTAILD